MSEKISSSIQRISATDPGANSILPASIRGIDHSAFGGVPNHIPAGVSTSPARRQQTGPVRNVRQIYSTGVGSDAASIGRRRKGPKRLFYKVILRWTNIIGLTGLFAIACLIDLLIRMS